jgi:hypothetical protein
MKFELERLIDYSDDEIIAEIRRVGALGLPIRGSRGRIVLDHRAMA